MSGDCEKNSRSSNILNGIADVDNEGLYTAVCAGNVMNRFVIKHVAKMSESGFAG